MVTGFFALYTRSPTNTRVEMCVSATRGGPATPIDVDSIDPGRPAHCRTRDLGHQPRCRWGPFHPGRMTPQCRSCPHALRCERLGGPVPEECVRLLGTRSSAGSRQLRRAPVILPVNYVVIGEQVVVRTRPRHPAGGGDAPRHRGVRGRRGRRGRRGAHGAGWRVMVQGVAREIFDPPALVEARRPGAVDRSVRRSLRRHLARRRQRTPHRLRRGLTGRGWRPSRP